MIEVDSKKVEDNIKKLSELIGKYDENIENLFYDLKGIESFWYGSDKNRFIDLIKKEQLNSTLLFEKLDSINTFFSFSTNRYSSLISNINSKLD